MDLHLAIRKSLWKKGCEEMIGMSSRSFFVGEIPWGCEVMAHTESFLPIPSHPCLWGINFCKNKVLDRKKAFSYNKKKGKSTSLHL